jgi:phage shock protein C
MQNKRLYRSCKDRILGGVAGGMAEYLEIDPIIARLVWIALVISGVGVILYIIAWVLIPNDPQCENKKDVGDEMKEKANAAAEEIKKAVGKEGKNNYSLGLIFGALLIFLGIGLFFQNIIGVDFWKGFWPVVLIVVGLVLIMRAKEAK